VPKTGVLPGLFNVPGIQSFCAQGGPIDFPATFATMTSKESAVPKTATRKPPALSFSQALDAFLKVDPRRLPKKGKLKTKSSPRKKKRR
jgi:hypothetical protein